eukprot:SAG31_NODE_2434_length_5705_cov_6.754014_9_plen_241_part_00
MQDYHREFLSNVTFRRCIFDNNRDYGIIISPAGLCGPDCTQPKNLSIALEDCSIVGGLSQGLTIQGVSPNLTGSIEVTRLRVSGTPGPAVLLANKAALGASFRCTECHFDASAFLQTSDGLASPHYPGSGAPMAVLSMGAVSLKARDNGFVFGGAHFEACTVETAAVALFGGRVGVGDFIDLAPPPPLLGFNGGSHHPQVIDVTGDLRVFGCARTTAPCCTLNITGAGSLSRTCVPTKTQ